MPKNYNKYTQLSDFCEKAALVEFSGPVVSCRHYLNYEDFLGFSSLRTCHFCILVFM